MSLTFGFYNSINGDRKYNAIEMSSIFDGIIKDGIFATVENGMAVTSNGSMDIAIDTGRAWFNHTWTLNNAKFILTIEASDLVLNRIDAVVLEIDSSVSVRANAFKIVKGTAASSPVRPSLVKTEMINQYPLAYVAVNAGVTSISQANITTVIGTAECPYITGILETVSVDSLLSQWSAQFDEWFQRMKNQLSTDAAGNLQTQVDSLNANKEPTFTKNTAFNKNFGTTSDTVCQGNDSRLSDSRRASNIGMSYNGNLYITYS